ncbi:hypothetical protein GGR52DRAFT_538823 [Hypoxylon sp. FL1284]|nr:hypothetical protein GGR52DRAFT_538823 [Hypoxylon sp. FL1284]
MPCLTAEYHALVPLVVYVSSFCSLPFIFVQTLAGTWAISISVRPMRCGLFLPLPPPALHCCCGAAVLWTAVAVRRAHPAAAVYGPGPAYRKCPRDRTSLWKTELNPHLTFSLPYSVRQKSSC